MKLGSLFDGAGTCPLAGSMCGVQPVWANTRQKWKALEKAWAVHERERREGSV